jgi:hypothetical protein
VIVEQRITSPLSSVCLPGAFSSAYQPDPSLPDSAQPIMQAKVRRGAKRCRLALGAGGPIWVVDMRGS